MLKQMENEKFKNLSELVGKHGKVKESEKSLGKKEEKFLAIEYADIENQYKNE